MSIYILSDTHFGHANVIKYCDRPFKSVEEMDDVLCENWNHTVRPGDVVYHLGDVAFGQGPVKEGYYLMVNNMLNGEKYFIRGNHDESVGKMEKCGLRVLNPEYGAWPLEEYKILLTHRPMPDEKIPEGWVNVHGHIHNSVLDSSFSKEKHYNVSVDVQDFKPKLLEDILRDLER